MRILVIEDEPKAGEYLKKGLTESGFVVDWVSTGSDGLHQAKSETYDLIVLDVMLPVINGWKVLEEIRRIQETPVLLLTARDQLEDRLKGFDLGADDYLVKPFAFAELIVRIRALLRRGPIREADYLAVGDLVIDVLKRRVVRSGTRIELTAREFALLLLLAKRQGEVLSRSFIASNVWDMNFDSDTNVVDVAVRRLRAKVDDPYPSKLIHTVRGMGYLLEERQ